MTGQYQIDFRSASCFFRLAVHAGYLVMVLADIRPNVSIKFYINKIIINVQQYDTTCRLFYCLLLHTDIQLFFIFFIRELSFNYDLPEL